MEANINRNVNIRQKVVKTKREKNILWVSLYVLLAAVSIWFIGKTGYSLLRYLKLEKQIEAVIEKWEVKELGANRYGLVTLATYNFLEKEYKSEVVHSQIFPNPWAAEKAKSRMDVRGEKKLLWFNPRKPDQVFVEKNFPLKSCISTLVLLGLIGYFISLPFFMKENPHGTNQRENGRDQD